ncbi:DUF6338 family protein [Bacillus sp. (in: firmicutes)]|uniref:DUF6338 family protein n=1 Tax=Bacillus sp. TaxID=1409 RepID=UPI0028FE7DA1|nr:DUF6338 family protein [Bacillus sp. (in: firmicutes)]MDU2391251.1 DUF6338 family protein [Bacillus sp. (in: firmicutes)]
MQFSELTIRLLLIFFPGIISSLILDSLTSHRERDFRIFLLHSFVLGLTSYFTLYVLISINNFFIRLQGLTPSLKMNFLDSLIDKKASINIKEVIIATLLAIILALFISALVNHKILHKFAKKIKITKKFGQLDVWSYVFDSPDIDWIIVRDLENNLMYQGWVEAFSDTYDNNELFIRDVYVYRNSTAEELYFMQGIYIAKDTANLIIEFPQVGNYNP